MKNTDTTIKGRIIMFSGFFLPHVGGIERYIYHLSHHLVLRGWDVTVITSQCYNTTDLECLGGVRVFRFPSFFLGNGRMPLPKLWKRSTWRRFRALKLQEADIIIIHTYLFPICLVGSIIGWKYSIPIYAIGHGSGHIKTGHAGFDILLHGYEHLMAGTLRFFVDKYFAVSKRAEAWWKHFGVISSGTIYNGIDFSSFSNIQSTLREELGISTDTLIIAFAARILPDKGGDSVLKAFLSIDDIYPDLHLVIAGDGPDLVSLQNLASEHPHVHFLGQVDHSKVLGLFAAADIFAYPSRYPEGLPTCVLEAGAMGCAVIASSAGGTEEVIVDRDYGRIVNTEHELVMAICELINDSKLRNKLAKNIEHRVASCFDWSAIVPVFERIIIDELQLRGNK